jgi:peptide/nickel transport system ATP-binding protein/oligopeptide transport system ATP-binding protein
MGDMIAGPTAEQNLSRTGSRDIVLDVRDLQVSFETSGGIIHAVDHLDLTLQRGEILAIVGESGSGKTVTALSLLGLARGPRTRIAGEILYGGRNLVTLSNRQLRHVRGAEIAMIFQDPLSSLNPLQRVGQQIVEILQLHRSIGTRSAWARAEQLLREVGIPDPGRRAHAFPHEMSGGMRQRVMIAMALACDPKILIADEPTTALDVTIQAQVLGLISRLRDRHGTGVVLITHDLGIVADLADKVAVMYAGRIVEFAARDALFAMPQHPYTWGLLGSVPRIDGPRKRRFRSIEGHPPSLLDLPPGCRFAPRCAYVFERCSQDPQLASRLDPTHLDACWLSAAKKQQEGQAIVGAIDAV